MENTIDRLIKLIAQHLVFDEKNYPELKGADEKKRLAFAIRHSALHFSKTAGKLSSISEDIDHGAEMDISDLKKQLIKSTVNTLRLAELLEMSEKDIACAVEEVCKEQPE